jgi:hypothetical protein
MSGSSGSRIYRGLAPVWSATTIIYSSVVCAAIIRDPTFHLNVGVMKMTGKAALQPMMPPALIGLVGFALILWHVRWGGSCSVHIRYFGPVCLLPGCHQFGMLRLPSCTRTMRITKPWAACSFSLSPHFLPSGTVDLSHGAARVPRFDCCS